MVVRRPVNGQGGGGGGSSGRRGVDATVVSWSLTPSLEAFSRLNDGGRRHQVVAVAASSSSAAGLTAQEGGLAFGNVGRLSLGVWG